MCIHHRIAAVLLLALAAFPAASAQAATLVLPVTIRDLTPATNPDFEDVIADDRGIVQNTLGADGKPVYAHGANPTVTVHSQTTYDQWYHDTPGVNIPIAQSLTLDDAGHPGTYSYSNFSFFPIDGQGFGNYDGTGHNFHFTLEMHTVFTYQGGETFNFLGDDDVWVFVNKQLALDLGGVHGAEAGSVNLDAMAGALGISTGNDYNLDFFFAERHTVASEIQVETSLQLRQVPGVPEPGTKASVLLGLALLSGTAVLRRRG
ncbi:MAG TPA: fibro-slime domain-containing protein [Candidatus Saccharimonadales bacterium]|nr:fibro-slime domain-containing protein [Candidatus Saccharimonadales bacterium]